LKPEAALLLCQKPDGFSKGQKVVQLEMFELQILAIALQAIADDP
jgi:hypothetical protein